MGGKKILGKLSLEEKVGQVFMIWCRAALNRKNPEYLQWREAMQKYHVGSFAMTVHVDGLMLLRSEPYEAAELLNRLQHEFPKLPLLVAAQRGVAMRLLGTTTFPTRWPLAPTGACATPRNSAASLPWKRGPSGCAGISSRSADVNSNPAVINTRSFGEDPKEVADLVTAYIKGAHAGGMLTTVKHFPGHGEVGDRFPPGRGQRESGSRPPGAHRTPAVSAGNRSRAWIR